MEHRGAVRVQGGREVGDGSELVLAVAVDTLTYQQLADEHVLDPLGLAAGAVTANPPENRHPVARTLFWRRRAPWTLDGPILPAGGLWSTPRTMASLVVGLLVEPRPGPPAPTWRRANSSMSWHNGATGGASVVAVARPPPGRLEAERPPPPPRARAASLTVIATVQAALPPV
ncbi:serine hydrolase [Streptomyces sp. NPDC058611]|uniref:serine hydrolase n=1 Tax=unclassified Streptomyces TaxID=2593676 RepID=UPI00365A6CF0